MASSEEPEREEVNDSVLIDKKRSITTVTASTIIDQVTEEILAAVVPSYRGLSESPNVSSNATQVAIPAVAGK